MSLYFEVGGFRSAVLRIVSNFGIGLQLAALTVIDYQSVQRRARLRQRRKRFAPPPGDVRKENILSKVELRLEENPPSSSPAPPFLKRVVKIGREGLTPRSRDAETALERGRDSLREALRSCRRAPIEHHHMLRLFGSTPASPEATSEPAE